MTCCDFGTSAVRFCGAAALLLGWRPSEFWEATPAELAAALEPGEASDAPGAEVVADLMRRFPDEREK